MSEALRAFSQNPTSVFDLVELCKNSNELIIFLLKSGLLGDRSGLCEICKKGNVNLTKKEGIFYWKCGASACRKTISLKKGSFFENSKLEFKTILFLIYCWIYQLPTKFIIASRLGVSCDKTIVDWKNFCRDVCVEILISDNKKIGGRGHVVEIDESKFGKRKYNRGRRVDGSWVLGGIDRQTRDTFFEIVEDRSAETLLPILIKNIHPESIVISDCWKAYSKLSQHFAEHKQINHSLQFVDPNDKKVHTNTIESQWRVLKRNVLPRSGTSHKLMSSYFSMYCVQSRYLDEESTPCPFKGFLELIKRAYPLDSVKNTPRKDLRDRAKENEPPVETKQVERPPKRRLELSDDEDFLPGRELF